MEEEYRSAISIYAEKIAGSFSTSEPIGQRINEFVNSFFGTIEERELEVWADGKLEMAPTESKDYFIVVVSPNHNKNSQTFTIAHEIGHLFLHTDFVKCVKDKEKVNFSEFYQKGNSEIEQQANEFAESLLMPQDMFIEKVNEYRNVSDNTVDIKAVSDFFRVSVDVAINRGKWLGVLQW